MRLYQVKDIKEGMILGKSIYHTNGKLLLGAGYRINNEILQKLENRGYSYVYIMEEGTEYVIPEDVISEEVRSQTKIELSQSIEEIKSIAQFKDLTYEKATDLLESGYLGSINIGTNIRKLVKEILNDILEKGSRIMTTILIKTKDEYFLDHAVNTTVLASLIGSRYRFTRDELTILGLGTMLHDIGKIVTDQIKKNDGSKSEFSLYKEHPTYGYLLLKNNPKLSPMETQIVHQHHEFQDGSGFPIGLKGQNTPPIKTANMETKGQIFRLAEICCVANAFDKLVLNPLEKKSRTPEEALRQLIHNAGNHYNRHIVETLHQVVPMFPVGTRVKIVDIVDPGLLGSFGVVAKINEENLNRPVIVITANKQRKKIKPILLDTSKLNRIELKLII